MACMEQELCRLLCYSWFCVSIIPVDMGGGTSAGVSLRKCIMYYVNLKLQKAFLHSRISAKHVYQLRSKTLSKTSSAIK